MADFISSKSAKEIETVLTDALLCSTPQELTETEKAFIRQKIGATELGEGIKIVAHFDTPEELEAAVPEPEAGDAYSIGTETPFSLYIYDAYHEAWIDHGPIRANDITARFAQNVTVLVDAWEEDTTVFEDYSYKAAIPLGELTGEDFPIVGFAPAEASSGNYAQICFAFDGYVEIWARAIPAGDIIIPAITFIVFEESAQGVTSKGVTNADGGIATGGIDTAKLADGSVTAAKVAAAARTQYFDLTVGTEGWEGVAPWRLTLEAADLTADTELTVALAGESTEELETAFAALSWAAADGFISFTSTLEPGLDIPVTISYTVTAATTLEATLATGDWTGAAPYTQTIAVEGLLESDRAVVRFSAPDSFDELEAQQEAFSALYRADSADGVITLRAKELPETAFNAVLEVARI